MSFCLCVLYSGRSTVHAETPSSRICDKRFFPCGPYREDYNGRPSAIYRSKHCNGRLQACVDRQKSRSTLVNLAINVLRVLRHAHARIFAWLLGTCISETTADIAGNQTSMPEDQRELYTMQTTNAKVSRRQRHRGG